MKTVKKNGVTAIELIIVVIIVGILTAIAIPIYNAKVDRTRAERAVANIELIVPALKMYYIKHESAPPNPDVSNLSDINTALGLDLHDEYFTYSITSPLVPPGGTTSILAEYDAARHVLYGIDLATGDPDGWDLLTSSWPELLN